MSIDTRAVEYTHGDKAFEGVLALDSHREGKRPAVLVFHGWEGRSEAQLDFARKLTDWGYAGFACDLYGKGLRGTTPDECRALMTPLVADRATLRGRIPGLGVSMITSTTPCPPGGPCRIRRSSSPC